MTTTTTTNNHKRPGHPEQKNIMMSNMSNKRTINNKLTRTYNEQGQAHNYKTTD